MLTTYYSDILQNAPFRRHIFKIFFASGGKGALTPLTKILRKFPWANAVSDKKTMTTRTITVTNSNRKKNKYIPEFPQRGP